MSWSHIYSVILRHIYLFPKSFDRITDLFFWPILDVILWGLASQWMIQSSENGTALLMAILCALVYWRIVWQANYEIGVNLLEECWNKNLTNVLSSPLSMLEWLAGTAIVGLFKLILVVIVLAVTIELTNQLNIFSIGPIWLVCFVLLTISGWSLGLISAALVLRIGIRAQALTWTLAFVFAPLSAVYFPVAQLPAWAQKISLFIPSTYVFEALRAQIFTKSVDLISLGYSLVICIVYLALGVYLAKLSFERCRRIGFDHLE